MTDDDLLYALDQLTNTVYWCRQRGMPITAGSAILEAVGDWLDSQDPTGDDVPSVTAVGALDANPLAIAFGRLGRHLRAPTSERTSQNLTKAFTDALSDWTAAAVAEHHRSIPFGNDTRQTP